MDNLQQKNEIVVYEPDETTRLDVRLDDDTVWLTQNQMTDLFQRDCTVITRHINNVFSDGELDDKSNVHFLHIPFSDKPVKVYSLNVIISVGYRVKSMRGTQFRIWATNVLREYLLRGYAVKARLNQLEDKVDRRFAKTEADIAELKDTVGKYGIIVRVRGKTDNDHKPEQNSCVPAERDYATCFSSREQVGVADAGATERVVSVQCVGYQPPYKAYF